MKSFQVIEGFKLQALAKTACIYYTILHQTEFGSF